MLIPMKAILQAADKYGFAQAAFNVNAVSQIKAATQVHRMLRSPAIFQGADLANGFMGGRTDFKNATLEDKKRGAENIVRATKKYAGADDPDRFEDVPVAIHLDHGKSFDTVRACIDSGYTSVMIDGSNLPLNENIELTREVVRYAHPLGVTVEGELGVLSGVEDDVFSQKSTYTNPLSAIDFFCKTKVDALAISYGTKHGANKGKDTVIRKEIVMAIRECMRHEGIDGFLVSHGSSTVPQYIVKESIAMGGRLENTFGIKVDQLLEAVSCGISKINVDTDIRLACARNMRELFQKNDALRESEAIGAVYSLLKKNPADFDPRTFFAPVMDAVMYGDENAHEDVRHLLNVVEDGVKEAIAPLLVRFGSVGMIPCVERVTLEQMAERYIREGI